MGKRGRSRDKEFKPKTKETKATKRNQKNNKNKDKAPERQPEPEPEIELESNKDNNNSLSNNNNNTTLSPPNALNINHSWHVYFDETYKQNFYYNPFTSESVWVLPEGAKLDPNQTNTVAITKDNNNEEYNKSNKEAEEVPNDEYKDHNAWDEKELSEKLLWDKFKSEQLSDWMKRPARQQVTDTRKETAYIEGNYDYNIWYDKYLTDRKEEKEKIPAMYKCSPGLDTGFTRADKLEKEGSAYFCLYFAKGCCSEGVNCRYYHHVPTLKESNKIENLRDIFGRSRFATALKDNGGVGLFTKECRSLNITDLKKVETKNPVKDMVRIIYENFSHWGEIEDINYIPIKNSCYIRYTHRCFAEFAKEAMMRQSLVGEEIISVKWAYEDPNPVADKLLRKEEENKFIQAYKTKEENLRKIKEDAINKEEITKNCTKLQEVFNNIDNLNEEDNN